MSRTTPVAPVARVLLVTGEYPPTIGGVGDYTATLAAHLRGAGAQTTILTGVGNPLPGEQAVRRTVPDWGVRGWPAIGRAIAASKPDLVHIQYQAGAFAGRGGIVALPWWLARRTTLPIAVTFHDRHVPYLFPKAGPLRAFALRALARGGAATIVTNGDDWAAFRADWTTERHLHLIPDRQQYPGAARS